MSFSGRGDGSRIRESSEFGGTIGELKSHDFGDDKGRALLLPGELFLRFLKQDT